MARKRKNKKLKNHTTLTPEQKKSFAQALIDGKMFKQLVAEYNIAASSGYAIMKELLEYRLEWKNKEL